MLANDEVSEVSLTTAERQRADAFLRERDRQDFIAAHLLVRLCGGRLLGLPAERLVVVQSCPACGGTHGPPSIDGYPGVGVSFSHAPGMVAAVTGFEVVGIDVEVIGRSRVQAGELQSVLSPKEIAALRRAPDYHRAFLRQWVRKEALVKVGAATLGSLADLDLSQLELDHPPVASEIRMSSWTQWCLVEWTDREGRAIGTVVSRQPARVEFVTRR